MTTDLQSRIKYRALGIIAVIFMLFVIMTLSCYAADDAGSKAVSEMNTSEFNTYLKDQGFPKAYRTKLKKLHKLHPKWDFRAYDTGLKWDKAVKRIAKSAQIESGASHKTSYYTSSQEDYEETIITGTNDDQLCLAADDAAYIASWVKAGKKTTAFFMDPRNFLTEKKIFMFETLNYKPDYQTKAVVSKVLTATKLPKYGFTAKLFVSAGKKYDVSPVYLAARARQETGGGSIAIDGSQGVYNPYNIGARGSVYQGISYARKKGWTTQKKAVSGGAKYIAAGYINNNQYTIYYQRFDVKKNINQVGTHVYMTNIRAAYFEAGSVKTSYDSFGITNEAVTFEIPVYDDMPSGTTL